MIPTDKTLHAEVTKRLAALKDAGVAPSKGENERIYAEVAATYDVSPLDVLEAFRKRQLVKGALGLMAGNR